MLDTPTAPARLDTATATQALWRSVLPSASEIARARRWLHLKAIAIVVLAASSYWGLVLATVPVAVRLISAAGLIVGVVGVATSIMHDANHGAFSRSARLNRLVGYSSDLLGGSSWLWRFKHNQLHHGNTNVVGVDSDISQAPFARLAQGQPWRPWHRYQHLYLWFLYGFMTLKTLLIGDLNNLSRRRMGDQPLARLPRRRDLALVVLGKLTHLAWAVALPLMLHPWWAVLAFYLACSWLVGFSLALIFQLAHCVDVAEFAEDDDNRRGADYVLHQLRTTVDFNCRFPVLRHPFRWLVGGLDHQIEHHLAPKIPHTLYPVLAAKFRPLCATAGVRYRQHTGIWAGLQSHGRWLKAMGRPTPSIVR